MGSFSVCVMSAYENVAVAIEVRYRSAFALRNARRAYLRLESRRHACDFGSALWEHNCLLACMSSEVVQPWEGGVRCSRCDLEIGGVRVADALGGCVHWGCAPMEARVFAAEHAEVKHWQASTRVFGHMLEAGWVRLGVLLASQVYRRRPIMAGRSLSGRSAASRVPLVAGRALQTAAVRCLRIAEPVAQGPKGTMDNDQPFKLQLGSTVVYSAQGEQYHMATEIHMMCLCVAIAVLRVGGVVCWAQQALSFQYHIQMAFYVNVFLNAIGASHWRKCLYILKRHCALELDDKLDLGSLQHCCWYYTIREAQALCCAAFLIVSYVGDFACRLRQAQLSLYNIFAAPYCTMLAIAGRFSRCLTCGLTGGDIAQELLEGAR